MPNGHGGPRTPAHPASVSGPGSLSQRTDGGVADSQAIRRMPDAQYGESRDFEALQAGAPMAQSQPVDASRVVPIDAPSQYPDRPVTDGMEMAQPGAVDQDDLIKRRAWLPVLKWKASKPDASNSFRQLVRQLEGLS